MAKMSKANDTFIDLNHNKILTIMQQEDDDDDNIISTNEVVCAKAKRKKCRSLKACIDIRSR